MKVDWLFLILIRYLVFNIFKIWILEVGFRSIFLFEKCLDILIDKMFLEKGGKWKVFVFFVKLLIVFKILIFVELL